MKSRRILAVAFAVVIISFAVLLRIWLTTWKPVHLRTVEKRWEDEGRLIIQGKGDPQDLKKIAIEWELQKSDVMPNDFIGWTSPSADFWNPPRRFKEGYFRRYSNGKSECMAVITDDNSIYFQYISW